MNKLERVSCLLAGSAALLFSGTAFAQDEGLEEIIVTAQKREQSVLDIPIAISVLDAGEIEAFGATSLSEMQATVPSLVVSGQNGSEVSEDRTY